MEKPRLHTVHKPISIKESKIQPAAHFVYAGPEKKIRYIRYKTDYRLINKKILLIDEAYNDLFLDFVIDLNYKLILGDYHLFLSNNSDWVQGAGRLMVNSEGKITKLDNKSGHYKPSVEDCFFMLEYFNYNFILSENKFFIFDEINSYKAYILL